MNSQTILMIALAAIATLQVAEAFAIKDFASNKDPDAKLLALNIDTCPDASGEQCTFIKGKNATMTLDVEPSE